MKVRFSLLIGLPLWLCASTGLHAASPTPLEEDITVRAVLGVDGAEPVSVEVTVTPGETETVSIGEGYELEIATPEDDLALGEIRLLEAEGEQMTPLHTTRDTWRGEGWPTFGYLICGEKLRFFELADGDKLPNCS